MEREKIGIDEVGRGSIAGPVSICIFIWLKKNNIKDEYPQLRDSKKLTKNKRQEIYKELKKAKGVNLDWFFSSASANYIDKFGITKALEKCTSDGIKNLFLKYKKDTIFSDYNLPIEKKYNVIYLKNGDDVCPVISAASIIAKVKRDEFMNKLALKYKDYSLEKNKGYGTKEHFIAIKKYKISKIHRKTFLKNIA